MAELFTYPNMMDIPEFNLKLQKDMCYTLLFKRQIQITYDDESICICYNSHKTKVTIILGKLHPFITPNVYVDEIQYIDWMIQHSECAYSLLHRLKFSSPCCNSVLSNWT